MTDIWKSHIVQIGDLSLGGELPVRLQSMANTPTLDTKGCIDQCIRMIEAGAEMVRLTARDLREAENLAAIRLELLRAGFRQPLVADVHFNPEVALAAARIVEKVRINPGNYADKRARFERVELSDDAYRRELERVHQRLLPLLKVCTEEGTALRIGVNHGSLSDRIMSRYGNTPEGMVRSAMEFISICRSEGFHRLVLSLKSSNTLIMVHANRMLVQEMAAAGFWYPLHLGVTEAGAGADGRIRSATGMGSLLADGIGDTLRVSLSEPPEAELPVARTLVQRFSASRTLQQEPAKLKTTLPTDAPGIHVFKKTPVMADMTGLRVTTVKDYAGAGYQWDHRKQSFTRGPRAVDIALLPAPDPQAPKDLYQLVPFMQWVKQHRKIPRLVPLFAPESYRDSPLRSEQMNFLITDPLVPVQEIKEIAGETVLLLLRHQPKEGMAKLKKYLLELREAGVRNPVMLNLDYIDIEPETFATQAAADAGPLLLDRQAEGICLSSPEKGQEELLRTTAFNILQAARIRQEGVEYISCPTCGRTTFDLEKATREVKEATKHLSGLKIAIMGCVVNGPGEMADADYGYIGAGPGKVHLYKGRKPVSKNVPQEKALNELLRIIGEEENKTR